MKHDSFFSDIPQQQNAEYQALKSCIDRAKEHTDNLQEAKLSFLSDITKHNELQHLTENPKTFNIINQATTMDQLIGYMTGFSVLQDEEVLQSPSTSDATTHEDDAPCRLCNLQ